MIKGSSISALKEALNIRFSYNGDLGTLQQKTKDNLHTIEMLQFINVISSAEAKELRDECKSYFKEQIEIAAKSPNFFIEI